MALGNDDELIVELDGSQLKSSVSFKYLGSSLQRDGGLDAEIQHRLNCGWFNWRRMSGVICDKRVNCKMKGKVYRSVVRPSTLFGTNTWLVSKRQEKKMEVAERRMLRWMCGVTRIDRIRNEEIRGTVGVVPLGRRMQEARMRWFGHVQRRKEDYVERRMLDLDLGGRRGRGRC
ncbi:uncharacterized protein LOC111056513 [Nilaparvata lugens]|uniref:uncharacterized protein LOC111056513 n=1 Tax=Nilaparvata lugens TaxID=108931 RepID=UPI00193CE32E|nr:uncharacterized protein LOC111056513 [Nilaparvata lugens]